MISPRSTTDAPARIPSGQGQRDKPIGHDRLIRPQPGDDLLHQFPDEARPRVVLVGFGRGGVAPPFTFIPVHGGHYGDQPA